LGFPVLEEDADVPAALGFTAVEVEAGVDDELEGPAPLLSVLLLSRAAFND
jgi:hypothetical protein